MKKKDTEGTAPRQRAEKALNKSVTKAALIQSTADMKKRIHELEVHQTDLEMQVEELLVAQTSAIPAENIYSDSYELSPPGFITLSLDGKILAINAPAAQIMGEDKSLLTNTMLLSYVAGESKAAFTDFFEKVCRGNTKYTRAITLQNKQNALRDIHLEGINSDNGRECFLTITEVPELQRIGDIHFRLSQAIQQFPLSITITDLTGKIEFVNKKTLSLTGYNGAELIGNLPRFLVPGTLAKDEYNNLWKSISARKEWHGEFQNVRKGGELYWESIDISPIIVEPGECIQFLIVSEDISPKKQVINELISARTEAETANKLKDTFISNISHEMRTPLNGIIGMTDFIIDTYSQFATEEDKQLLVSMQRSSKRLINTVEMILNYSHLVAGEYPGPKTNVSICSILQTLVSFYTLNATSKFLKIIFSPVEDDMVLSDQAGLYIAFGNIIDNALKFTRKGSVHITVSKDERNKLVVTIADTGIGISEDYLNQLFGQSTHELIGFNRSNEGLGLGLPVAKKILESSGATISVKSIKDKGTTFTICFDEDYIKKNITKVPTGEDVDTPVQIKRKPLILSVEDDIDNQLYLLTILKRDYIVIPAASAVQALKIFETETFDIVLMDISLKKGLNGMALTRIIRAGQKNPDVPVIAVTGHAFSKDYQNALEAGCSDFLAKPFVKEQLLKKIEKWIHLSSEKQHPLEAK